MNGVIAKKRGGFNLGWMIWLEPCLFIFRGLLAAYMVDMEE